MESDLILKKKEFDTVDEQYANQSAALTIADEQEYAVAEAYTKAINETIKERKAYFKPMKDRAKQVHQDWVNAEKESVEVLDRALGAIKGKMTAYFRAKQEEARRQEEALRKDAIAQGLPEHVAKRSITVEATPVSSMRTYYYFEVTDFKALPEEYKIPNEKRLQEVANETKGEGHIYGVRIWKESRAVVGR